MNEIKPIETHYNGYRFRSRLEARWAVFFDSMRVEWEYEKEGFNLGKGVKYLPDFWLPRFGGWVEVKSHPLELDNSMEKAIRLVGGRWANDYVDEPLIELVGMPDFKVYRMFCVTDIPAKLFANPLVYRSEYQDVAILIRYLPMHRDILNSRYERSGYLISYEDWKHPEILKEEKCYVDAIAAARSARYEHGEHS